MTTQRRGAYAMTGKSRPARVGIQCRRAHRFAMAALLAAGVSFAQVSPDGFPPAGIDEFDSSAIITIDLTSSGGPEITLTLVGPARIDRSDPFDPGDGRDVIETEILSMDLRGTSALGPITLRESGRKQSSGIIRQQTPSQDFPAESFFDVFVEVSTDVGVFHNQDPIRLQAVIEEIPPFQAMYIPDATFVGVDLFNAAGVRVGILRHAAHFVGQAPSFSVAPAGPSGLFPATLFDVPTAPGIRSPGLGLTPADNVDGLSYGIDYIAPVFEARFSVDERAVGLPGTAVFRESGKTPPQAHGDEFRVSSPPASGNLNTQVLDENGDTAPRFPLLVADDVDALTEPPTSFVDPDGDGTPDLPVYLSLAAGSPTLASIGAGPADILRTIGGGPPTVLFTAADLGLQAGDDIDAFCYDDRAQTLLFSLAPGSPTLGPGVAAASLLLPVFQVDIEPSPVPAPPIEFASPNSLGLREDDNLNALKCILPEVDHFPESLAVAAVNGAEVVLRGPTTIHVGVGPGGDTGDTPAKQHQPVDSVPVEIVQMDLVGDTPLGPIRVTVRTEDRSPFERSLGFFVETQNLTEGVLDVPPFTREGSLEARLKVFLQFQVGQQVLHHEEPIQLFGLFSNKPPLFGEQLTSPSQVDLVNEEGIPAGTFTALGSFSVGLPALGPLPVLNAGGTVNAGDFQRGGAPDSINSSFGVNLSDRTEFATSLPLPTELAGVRLRVKDSNNTKGSDDEAHPLGTLQELFVVTPGQVNWVLRGDTAPGLAQLTLTRKSDSKGILLDEFTSTRTFLVVAASPSIFTANADGQGVPAAFYLRFRGAEQTALEFVFDQTVPLGAREPLLIDFGGEDEQVFIAIFGTGMRGGIVVRAMLDGEDVPVSPVFPHEQFVGLDQANVGAIPRSFLGRGIVELKLTIDDIDSNSVLLFL